MMDKQNVDIIPSFPTAVIGNRRSGMVDAF